MYKIKILKDTPFDRANTELTIKDFRLKYNYICTNDTTDEQLIAFLKNEYKYHSNHLIDYYFQVIEMFELILPLCFVYEDLWYVKEIDGTYHVYTTPITKEINTFVNIISQPEARQIISNSKYKNNVLVCTNFVNRQMK
jgi:hypothetical protein